MMRLSLLLFLALPAVVQAQFSFTTNNGAITITGYTGPGGLVTISNTINDLAVTCIGSNAFASCIGLTGVSIPESVNSIESQAFYSCTSLTNVTIPDSVTSIGEGAFTGCTSLTKINIGSGVKTMGDSAFSWCTNLTEAYFHGNSPNPDWSVFGSEDGVTLYYLPGTTGWDKVFDYPTALWRPTADASSGMRTNQFGFNVAWASGMVVVVEACTNLGNPTWSPLQTNLLTSDSWFFSDPEWTNHPARLYRLRSS